MFWLKIYIHTCKRTAYNQKKKVNGGDQNFKRKQKCIDSVRTQYIYYNLYFNLKKIEREEKGKINSERIKLFSVSQHCIMINLELDTNIQWFIFQERFFFPLLYPSMAGKRYCFQFWCNGPKFNSNIIYIKIKKINFTDSYQLSTL